MSVGSNDMLRKYWELTATFSIMYKSIATFLQAHVFSTSMLPSNMPYGLDKTRISIHILYIIIDWESSLKSFPMEPKYWLIVQI